MIDKLRSLATDTAIYGVSTIVGRFLTFMLTPIYTNYMSMDEVGDYTFIFAIIAFMMIIFGFGMEPAFFRFFSHDDEKQSKKAYSQSYISIILLSGVITTVILLNAESIAPYVTDLPDATELIMLGALIPLLDAMMVIPFSLLRMKRKARRFAITRFFLIVLAVSLNILFIIHFRMGVKGILLAQVIANLCGVLIFVPEIIKHLQLKIDKSLMADMFRFGIPTVPAMLAGMILQVADRPILKALTDSAELGIYSVNYRLGIPMMLFVAVFEYAWKPFYLSHFQDKDAKQMFARILTYFTLMCAGIFLLTGLFMDYLVRLSFIGGKLINPEYWSGMGIIPIILTGYYFNGVFNNFAAGFQIEKKTKYLPVAVGIAALVNIGMNFILIPIIGYWGAAWATLGAYFVSALVLYFFTRKVYPIQYEWRRILIIIISAGAVYGFTIYLTASLAIVESFIIRFLSLFVFLGLIWRLGFFTSTEIKGMKKLFSSMTSK